MKNEGKRKREKEKEEETSFSPLLGPRGRERREVQEAC